MSEKESKKTTIGVLESTQYNFNCAKVENKFKTADDFIMFLLGLLSDFLKENGEIPHKPLGEPIENEKYLKGVDLEES